MHGVSPFDSRQTEGLPAGSIGEYNRPNESVGGGVSARSGKPAVPFRASAHPTPHTSCDPMIPAGRQTD